MVFPEEAALHELEDRYNKTTLRRSSSISVIRKRGKLKERLKKNLVYSCCYLVTIAFLVSDFWK